MNRQWQKQQSQATATLSIPPDVEDAKEYVLDKAGLALANLGKVEKGIAEALENAEIDYTRGVINLDGSSLGPGDLEKTFADFGITEKCYLLNVVKADNATR